MSLVADLDLLPEDRIFERHFEVVPEIGTSRGRASGGAPSPTLPSEKGAENITEISEDVFEVSEGGTEIVGTDSDERRIPE